MYIKISTLEQFSKEYNLLFNNILFYLVVNESKR